MKPSKQSRIEIPGKSLLKPVVILISLVTIGSFWGFFVVSHNLVISLVISIIILAYLLWRTRYDLKSGWFLEESNGIISWYEGGLNNNMRVADIKRIHRNGTVTLLDESEGKLPSPDENFLPVYLHLYDKYPRLFAAEPELDSGPIIL